jgi:hypothetical protein
VIGSTLEEYCQGVIDTGYSRIRMSEELGGKLPYQGSVNEHLRFLGICDSMIKGSIKSPTILDIAGPMLVHPDLNKRNIYVSPDDPTRITTIID